MADEEQGAAGEGKQLLLQRIYLKDCSFEAPNSPQIFSGNWEPKVNLNISTDARALDGDVREVALKVTVEAVHDDKTALLAEVEQAGTFLISGFTDAEVDRIIGSFCPNVLYPYAREQVASLVTKGGFPQLLIQPLNFDHMYQQHLDAQAQNPGAENAN